jgi:hypothetical protein
MKNHIPTMDELYAWLGQEHAIQHARLRKSKALWATLPAGAERDRAAMDNSELSSNMMLLRYIARVMTGADSWEDDNPFGGPDDY